MAGLPPLDPAKMQLVQELEIEMMSDMYNRMTNACHRKCIPPKYKDAELGKGEAVCIDRCIAKYLDIHERVGKKLTELSMQDDEVLKKIQAEQARMSALHAFVKENILLAMIETCLEKRNSTLNLSNFEIKEIPNLVFRLKDLSKLYLSRNSIENLPEKIFEFPYLKVLALDYNAITSIPNGLEKLTELTDLNLSHNNLRHLTSEIGKLAKLELFWVNHTHLESLPPEIGNCTYLDTFGARGNFLTELPPEIGKLRHLRWLTLEGNLLRKIPDEISQLRNLIHLNLSHNQLETFPKIEDLHKLQFVYLSHNFIKEVDPEALQKLSYVSKIDLSENIISKDDPCLKGVRNVKIDDSFVMPQEENEHGDSYSDSDADSDSNDWELSVPSSILNLSQSSVEEMQLDDIFESALPQVARFSAIGS